MKQKMKRIFLSFLLLLTLGLLLPLTVLADDFKNPEEAAYIREMSEETVRAITELGDYDIEQYIIQFEAMDESTLADGLRAWQELRQDIGPAVSVVPGEIKEVDGGYVTDLTVTCESGRTATVSIGIDQTTGDISLLNFEKDLTLGEKLQDGAFNLVVGMGTVFAVLIFIAYIISQFKHVNAWVNAREARKKEEAEYYAKVEAAKKLPAVSKNVSSRISGDAVRAAKIPADAKVELIEADVPAQTEAPAAESESVMDGQLLAVLAAAVAAAEGPDAQLIAVMTAAIQAYRGDDAGPDGLVVRSIRRVSGRGRRS